VSCCSRRVPSSVVPLCHSRVNVVMFSRPRGFVRVHVYALRSARAHARARARGCTCRRVPIACVRRREGGNHRGTIHRFSFCLLRITRRFDGEESRNGNRTEVPTKIGKLEHRLLVCRSLEKKDSPKGKNILKKKKKRKEIGPSEAASRISSHAAPVWQREWTRGWRGKVRVAYELSPVTSIAQPSLRRG